MLVQSGIERIEYNSGRQILFMTQPYAAVGVQLKGTVAGVIKAGTPITGSLVDRNTPFQVTTAADAVGVTVHDVKVDKDGAIVNSECLIFGFVDVKKVEEDVAALYTDTIKGALDGKIFFLA